MIDNSFKLKGFVVWGICAVFFLYEFLLRTVIGTFQHPIMNDLNLSSFQFSILSTTVFLLIYGLMQIPVGIIVDNIGLKKSMIFGCLACTLASFGFSMASSITVATIFRLFMGLGASFGFICLLISVNEWMPQKYIAIFIGLSQFIGTLGPMAAAGPLDSLSESGHVTWRSIFWLLGIFGACLTILIYLFVENNFSKAGNYLIISKPEKISTSIYRLFSRKEPIYIALLAACLYFSIEYLSENEGRSFLATKNISNTTASYMITIAWIGYAIGCPLLGLLSDTFKRRKLIIASSSCLSLISIIGILFTHQIWIVQVSFFILGLSASGQSIGFATIAEHFKKEFLAVGFGLTNAVITTISAINAPIIGLFLDSYRGDEILNHGHYIVVFSILIVISLISVVLSFFYFTETYCKSLVNHTFIYPIKKRNLN